jgi:hypothetical protein
MTSNSTSTTSTTTTSNTTSSSSSTTAQPKLTIDSVNATGGPIQGLYVVLEQTSNSNITTGFTPATFNTIMGQNYTITATDDNSSHFNHWTNNFTVRVMPITMTKLNATYTALYTSSIEPPPTSTPYKITVTSNDLNGTAVSGFYVDVRVNGYHVTGGWTPATFTNLEPGLRFQVIFYWYGNYWLRGVSNGDLNRYAAVIFNSTGPTSVSYDGLYQFVPPQQAAALNVEAKLPNGTTIGTTFNNTSYIQHTPGMWLTVTPPNSTAPFTGTFTGGSILPFILFNHENYTVTMTPGYGCFSFLQWNDTASTNPARVVTLNGNTTLVAIYTLAGQCPSIGANAAASAEPAPLQVNSADKIE